MRFKSRATVGHESSGTGVFEELRRVELIFCVGRGYAGSDAYKGRYVGHVY